MKIHPTVTHIYVHTHNFTVMLCNTDHRDECIITIRIRQQVPRGTGDAGPQTHLGSLATVLSLELSTLNSSASRADPGGELGAAWPAGMIS